MLTYVRIEKQACVCVHSEFSLAFPTSFNNWVGQSDKKKFHSSSRFHSSKLFISTNTFLFRHSFHWLSSHSHNNTYKQTPRWHYSQKSEEKIFSPLFSGFQGQSLLSFKCRWPHGAMRETVTKKRRKKSGGMNYGTCFFCAWKYDANKDAGLIKFQDGLHFFFWFGASTNRIF